MAVSSMLVLLLLVARVARVASQGQPSSPQPSTDIPAQNPAQEPPNSFVSLPENDNTTPSPGTTTTTTTTSTSNTDPTTANAGPATSAATTGTTSSANGAASPAVEPVGSTASTASPASPTVTAATPASPTKPQSGSANSGKQISCDPNSPHQNGKGADDAKFCNSTTEAPSDPDFLKTQQGQAVVGSVTGFVVIAVLTVIAVAAKKRARQSTAPERSPHEQLVQAVVNNDTERVAALLHQISSAKLPFNIDEATITGHSACFLAAECGRAPILEKLLDAGASPDQYNTQRQSMLQAAVQTPFSETVTCLLHHGSDVNYQEPAYNHSALMLAIRSGNVAHVQQLIASGADLNAADTLGHTAIFHATLQNRPPVLRWLLEAGANPNIKDAKGLVPLHWAVMVHNTECVAVLAASRSTDLTVCNPDGRTALHLAAMNGDTGSVRALLSHNNLSNPLAFVLSLCSDQKLAAEYAAEAGHKQCEELLQTIRHKLADGSPTFLVPSPAYSHPSPPVEASSSDEASVGYKRRSPSSEPSDADADVETDAKSKRMRGGESLTQKERKKEYMRRKRETERQEIALKQAEVQALEMENAQLLEKVVTLRQQASVMRIKEELTPDQPVETRFASDSPPSSCDTNFSSRSNRDSRDSVDSSRSLLGGTYLSISPDS